MRWMKIKHTNYTKITVCIQPLTDSGYKIVLIGSDMLTVNQVWVLKRSLLTKNVGLIRNCWNAHFLKNQDKHVFLHIDSRIWKGAGYPQTASQGTPGASKFLVWYFLQRIIKKISFCFKFSYFVLSENYSIQSLFLCYA